MSKFFVAITANRRLASDAFPERHGDMMGTQVPCFLAWDVFGMNISRWLDRCQQFGIDAHFPFISGVKQYRYSRRFKKVSNKRDDVEIMAHSHGDNIRIQMGRVVRVVRLDNNATTDRELYCTFSVNDWISRVRLRQLKLYPLLQKKKDLELKKWCSLSAPVEHIPPESTRQLVVLVSSVVVIVNLKLNFAINPPWKGECFDWLDWLCTTKCMSIFKFSSNPPNRPDGELEFWCGLMVHLDCKLLPVSFGRIECW